MIHVNYIRLDFFILLVYVTRRSKKLGFQEKRKKKKKDFPNITTKFFVFGVIGNHFENYYFETSFRFGKLSKNYDK